MSIEVFWIGNIRGARSLNATDFFLSEFRDFSNVSESIGIDSKRFSELHRIVFEFLELVWSTISIVVANCAGHEPKQLHRNLEENSGRVLSLTGISSMRFVSRCDSRVHWDVREVL